MIVFAFIMLAGYVISGSSAARGQAENKAKDKPGTAQTAPSANRFDHLVREDFFAGLAGDREALARAIKTCEDALARNPKHAEAMVWHGCGIAFLAGEHYRKGDYQKGGQMWEQGMKEVGAAVALDPDNVGVLIPRGAFLIEATRYIPDKNEARALLEKGLKDYEKVFELQRPYFSKLSNHSRGELLIALAEGWHRMGNAQKAREYYDHILKECAGSVYADAARDWIEKGTITQSRKCTGCHAR
jgi:tetratricopeptide (TPR) repeat protein